MSAAANQPKWYGLTAEEIAKQLQVDPAKGLNAAEAQSRLQKYGPNKLAEKKKEPGWQAFLRQYKDLMQIILIGAAVISQVFTHQWGTTLVLVLVTVFNAVLGLRGEAKAAASLAALAETMKELTRVRRDGEAKEADVAQVVPGDVVTIAQWHLSFVDDGSVLGRGDALAGQGRFLDLQRGGHKQAPIGWNDIACLHHHNIAWHHLRDIDFLRLAIAPHPREFLHRLG